MKVYFKKGIRKPIKIQLNLLLCLYCKQNVIYTHFSFFGNIDNTYFAPTICQDFFPNLVHALTHAVPPQTLAGNTRMTRTVQMKNTEAQETHVIGSDFETGRGNVTCPDIHLWACGLTTPLSSCQWVDPGRWSFFIPRSSHIFLLYFRLCRTFYYIMEDHARFVSPLDFNCC